MLNGISVSSREVCGSCACRVCLSSRKGDVSVASKTRIRDPRWCAPLILRFVPVSGYNNRAFRVG